MNDKNTAVVVFGISPAKIGSAESFACELASQLGVYGWKCVLCFLSCPPDPVRRFLELPNVTLEVMEESWRLGWQPTRALARILRRHRPRILHLNYTGMLGPYPWIAKLLGVEKVFFTDEGSQPAGYVRRRAVAWKRLASRLVSAPLTGVITVSRYGYECLAGRDLIPRDRIGMIYNAVDVERAIEGLPRASEFRRRYSIPPDCLLVTQVSWMIPEKGIADLLAAAKQVIALEPKAHFMFAGDGQNRGDYERNARELGIADRATFTGMIQDPLTEGLFAAADVVCQMSRWEEVFGYVIAEAMASSKPVVATRVGGIPELVDHGTTGFLVERGDVDAMAARILEVLRSPALRAQMGEAGLRAVRQKFDLKTNVAQFLSLYGLGGAARDVNSPATQPSH